MSDLIDNPEWIADCMKWRGKVLTGKRAHWCEEWDGLPVDETTQEWPCVCCAASLITEASVGKSYTYFGRANRLCVSSGKPIL